MIQAHLSVAVNASKEKVYAVSADYANWPKYFPNYKSVHLISESRGERVIESVVTTRRGKTRTVKEIQRLVSTERIEGQVPVSTRSNLLFTIVTAHIIRTYQTENGGTRAAITVFFQPDRFYPLSGYRLFDRRLEKRIISAFGKQLETIKHAAEAT